MSKICCAWYILLVCSAHLQLFRSSHTFSLASSSTLCNRLVLVFFSNIGLVKLFHIFLLFLLSLFTIGMSSFVFPYIVKESLEEVNLIVVPILVNLFISSSTSWIFACKSSFRISLRPQTLKYVYNLENHR